MSVPQKIYEQEKARYIQDLSRLNKKRNRLGWQRLAVVVLTFLVAFQLFSLSLVAGYLSIAVGVGFFLLLVSIDVDNNHKIRHTTRLIQINEEELSVLAHHFLHRPDGRQFQQDQHAYATDLDLFGRSSLYQYINRCESEQGQQELADNFLNPLPAAAVLLRQDAVRELAPQVGWRQQFQALCMTTSIRKQTEKIIAQWVDNPELHFTKPFWKFFVPIYSCITLSTALLAIIGWMDFSLFTFLFILYFTFSTVLSKKAMKAYADLNGIIKETDTLYQVIEWIEQKSLQSPLLKGLQQDAVSGQGKAYVQIKRLKELLNRFDLRLNVLVFIFVNSFLLWDIRQMISLNRWRAQNKTKIHSWFRLIASFEVCNSLATLHFSQPAFAFPNITSRHFTLQGTAIGHPLLPPLERVTSDFNMGGTGKIAMVTGSNMAGKSTFLRSLGTNIVLALMGAPVCATRFEISPVQLMSSMRIADNLSENTSTFYAELKKLKTILAAVNRKEPVFILLDEILRGTNSLDRHIGSVAVVKQLIRHSAVAVIATHDVAIGQLEETYPEAIQNYHFDVQVAGEELYFDYKLKHGVCTSLNASLLMKKIGIEL